MLFKLDIVMASSLPSLNRIIMEPDLSFNSIYAPKYENRTGRRKNSYRAVFINNFIVVFCDGSYDNS